MGGPIEERVIDLGDVQIFTRSLGQGPLVLICHGFPQTSAAWVDYLPFLAELGYQAVAMDSRGHGRSSVPSAQVDYSIFALVGDVMGVADSFGADSFHLIGDDLGAQAAWNAALFRPDRVRSVAALSVPFFPRESMAADELLHMLDTKNETPYLLRLLEDDASREMAGDPRGWITGAIFSMSGRVPPERRLSGMVDRKMPISSVFVGQSAVDFVSPAILDEIVNSYASTEFRGSVYIYQRLVDDWGLLGPWHEGRVKVPSMFIGGELDPMRLFADGAIADLNRTAPGLRNQVQLPGVGHWPHLEQPAMVRSLLSDFLTSVAEVPGASRPEASVSGSRSAP